MNITLEQQAEQISVYALEVERLESFLTYTATMIAGMAADGQTGSTAFDSTVLTYKNHRAQLAAAKQAYAEALKGEN